MFRAGFGRFRHGLCNGRFATERSSQPNLKFQFNLIPERSFFLSLLLVFYVVFMRVPVIGDPHYVLKLIIPETIRNLLYFLIAWPG